MLDLQTIKNLLVVLFTILALTAPGQAQVEHRVGQESVRVEWTAGDDLVEWHELIVHFRQGALADIGYTVPMPTLEQLIPRPRSGKFEVRARACRITEEGTKCSNWINSALVGTPAPWIIFWKPGSVFEVIIEDF